MKSLSTQLIEDHVSAMSDRDLAKSLAEWANNMEHQTPLSNQALQERILYSTQFLKEAASRIIKRSLE